MHNKRTDTLVIIPARAGSKRLPGKNIKELNGKPLIQHSIDFALEHFVKDSICVTTDDNEVINIAKNRGLQIPFTRPDELATDAASSEDVIFHALNHYELQGEKFQYILLLQPTSPFRKSSHIEQAYLQFDEIGEELEGVISVAKKKRDYLKLLVVDNKEGFLEKPFVNSIEAGENVYEINGSMYLLKVEALKKYGTIPQFKKIKTIVMSEFYSVDIDTIDDWRYCEFILKENLLQE